MSSDAAIVVDDLGKRFRLSTRKWAGRFVEARPEAVDGQHFWALRHVGFEVGHGETLGLVGRNGAGKSTLLRLLSRITDPTEGRATLTGRVGSLLEVGAGFHPEITGRGNIERMGAILGMRRRETLARFDEIVEFAEVSAFIDAPVKHYSSGMYLRLAFSVAAHLDAEILLLDEALAVGDQRFRERCLAKIRDLASTGRTVVFVSHDAGSIARLCDRAVLLETGRVVLDGPVDEVLRRYKELHDGSGGALVAERPSDDVPHLTAIRRISARPGPQPVGEPLVLEFDLHVPPGASPDLDLLVELVGHDLWPVTGAGTPVEPYPAGHRRLRCSVPTLRLAPARYTVTVTLRDRRQPIQTLAQLGPFEVEGTGHPLPVWQWRYVEDADWTVAPRAAAPHPAARTEGT
jgi:ABC-type polysaccharide/polyol phosphate transport system ATPase subunit